MQKIKNKNPNANLKERFSRAKFLAENDELDETNWANFDLNTFNEIKAYQKKCIQRRHKTSRPAAALVI